MYLFNYPLAPTPLKFEKRIEVERFSVIHHIGVEDVASVLLLARVAAPGLSFVLALDALFRIALETLRRFLHATRGAGMALYATQGPVSR